MSSFVNIGGLKLRILQRKALDVIQLAEYVRRSEDAKDPQNQIFQYAMILRDSLKHNVNDYSWWQFLTRWRIKRAVSVRNIAAQFSLSELIELTKQVLITEGLTENEFEELKKKVIEQEEATRM